MDIILATFGAVLAFFTFVGGQYVLKLIIEPVQGMKKTIGEISYALIAQGKIISCPSVFDQKKKDEVYELLNMLSAQLQASYYLIPKCIREQKCKCLPCLFGLPSQDNILDASHKLQTLANCVVSNDDDHPRRIAQTRLLKNKICKNLDIFNREENEI